MQRTGGNKRGASAMADVSRQMLEKLMVKHGLK